jgi:hypothetical protein
VTQAPSSTAQRPTPKPIEIFVGERFETDAEVLTGEEIAAMAGLPAGNQLFLEIPGHGDDRPIGPQEKVKLRDGMCFYDVPAGNLG